MCRGVITALKPRINATNTQQQHVARMFGSEILMTVTSVFDKALRHRVAVI